MSEKVAPCPFCWSEDIWVPHPSDINTRVFCWSCRAEGPVKDTGQEALDAWNTRAGEKA